MTASSPSDLAVAFRSLHRRIDRALEPVDGDRSVGGRDLAEIDRVLAEAAAVLETTVDATAIARELEDRPAEAWQEPDLDRLRDLALRAGKLIRAVEDAASRRAGDGD
jgi:hypothetical protein